MERIASRYALAEAPVAAPGGGVYFSDVLGGGVHHFSPATGLVETVVAKRRGIGGMALHADGGLVMTGRDVVHVRDGESRTLYADPEIPGLNDLTIDPDGRLIVGCLRFHPFAGEAPIRELLQRSAEDRVERKIEHDHPEVESLALRVVRDKRLLPGAAGARSDGDSPVDRTRRQRRHVVQDRQELQLRLWRPLRPVQRALVALARRPWA